MSGRMAGGFHRNDMLINTRFVGGLFVLAYGGIETSVLIVWRGSFIAISSTLALQFFLLLVVRKTRKLYWDEIYFQIHE